MSNQNTAHDKIPNEHKSAIQQLFYNPNFLARLLLEEAEGAEGWAKAHADGASVTEVNGTWIPKRDVYAQKAKRFRDAACALNPNLSAVEVHSKETMDEVRRLLEEYRQYTWFCQHADVEACKDTLAKLNPPTP